MPRVSEIGNNNVSLNYKQQQQLEDIENKRVIITIPNMDGNNKNSKNNNENSDNERERSVAL